MSLAADPRADHISVVPSIGVNGREHRIGEIGRQLERAALLRTLESSPGVLRKLTNLREVKPRCEVRVDRGDRVAVECSLLLRAIVEADDRDVDGCSFDD